MLSPRASPDVWSVGSQASWRWMGSQDGTAQGITAKTEQHSHFGELHTTPTVTFTDAIRPPGLVWAEVVYLWFGWKL